MERISELLSHALDEAASFEDASTPNEQRADAGPTQFFDPALSSSHGLVHENQNLAATELENPETTSKVTQEEKASWSAVCSQLKKHLNPQIFAAWVQPLELLDFVGTPESLLIVLLAPNKFCAQHIQKNYLELIRAAFAQQCATEFGLTLSQVEVRLKVAEAAQLQAITPESARNAARARSASFNGAKDSNTAAGTVKEQAPARGPAKAIAIDNSNLNINYNFSNFVVGACNQFAHAVSLQVSENLGSTYNPLFIYGGVGLGKTHLANAIGNASRRRNKKVLLVSSETFVSELISSLRSNSMERFKSKFRSLDLLIIDDIQFIIGKERTQEEFFHTFNELYNHNKQIIVTCDKVPQELIGLEDRLRTRFACGVSADLQAPDFETRVAILIKKAQSRNIELSDDVARVLAERIDTNVRELEGALNRLIAMATVHNCAASVDLAKDILQTLSPSQRLEVTTDRIQKVVAEKFNVSIGDLLGKRRTHNIAFARQVAMYLCREHTGCSYPELGALFGGRDHSTVIHARKVISEKIKADTGFKKDLEQIEQSLHRQ